MPIKTEDLGSPSTLGVWLQTTHIQHQTRSYLTHNWLLRWRAVGTRMHIWQALCQHYHLQQTRVATWLALSLSHLTLQLLFIMKLCSYLNRKKAPRDQLKTFTSVEPFSYQGMYLLTKCWQNFPIQVAHRWVLSDLCGSQLRSHWKCPHLKTTPLDCETAALPARHPTQNQSPHQTHWETQGDYNTCVAAKIRTFSLKYCLNKGTGGFIFQTKTPLALPNEQRHSTV